MNHFPERVREFVFEVLGELPISVLISRKELVDSAERILNLIIMEGSSEAISRGV